MWLELQLLGFALLFGWCSGGVPVSQLEESLAGLGAKRNANHFDKRKFAYLDYDAIEKELKRLEAKYPDLLEVTDAQTKYGLPSPGKCGSRDCVNYIVRITNEATLPDPERPEVFFSGELHGNERVGPTTMMEFIRLLVESYYACDNPWLQRLVDTRSIYIMPSTNALGYYVNQREEAGVDPNRDFPIDSPRSCMETIAARALNELWREHLFQLALTYHGGMQAIGFEWGTVSSRTKDVSPDDNAQLMLGSSMSAFAGAFNSEGRYPHGRLNDEVYPVRGGMEDWAYAASWHSSSPCNPSRYNGYAAEKTRYEPQMLRGINILIECSRDKIPRESTLGANYQVLRPEGSGDGHVPRNIRLALLITDIVQPYLQWVSVDAENLVFSWEVGGAMHVDQTYLEYTFQTANGAENRERTFALQGATRWSGGGIFSGKNISINGQALNGQNINLDQADDIHDRDLWPYIPAFKAQLHLPDGATLLSVTAIARVDQAWKDQPRTPSPEVKPQSHLVNARTVADYVQENSGHKIVGRLDWQSETILFEGAKAGDQSQTVYSNPACTFPKSTEKHEENDHDDGHGEESDDDHDHEPHDHDHGEEDGEEGGLFSKLGFLVLLAPAFCGLLVALSLRRKVSDQPSPRYDPVEVEEEPV